jgi:hypothetical protein
MLRYQRAVLERDISGAPLHEDLEETAAEAGGAADADTEEVLKFGNLEKMGEINTKWQRRFFELKDGLLAYWTDKKAHDTYQVRLLFSCYLSAHTSVGQSWLL